MAAKNNETRILLLTAWALAETALRISMSTQAGLDALLIPRGQTSIVGFHLVAELFMAVVPAVGAVAWWMGRTWGPAVLVLGFGQYFYSIFNATGWAVVNDMALFVPLGFALLVVMALGMPLISRPESAAGDPNAARFVAIALVLALGTAVLGMWGFSFAKGDIGGFWITTADDNLRAYREVGEFAMILSSLLGALSWHKNLRQGPGLVLFSLGMFTYASINGLSFSLIDAPFLSIYRAATLGMIIFVVPAAMRDYQIAMDEDPPKMPM